MKSRPWLLLPLVAVFAPAIVRAQFADPVSVRKDALESLRAGLSFVDLSALAEPPRLTPDFIFAAIDSGEVTLDVLVNLLLTPAADVTDPRRDLLRDAIDVLLESTRRVTAAGDTPEHRVLRGRLLLAAARLQDAYQVEVAGLQDAAAGALTDAAALPDWQLPAGMVLRRIGGGARINTLTGAYSANLSGELLLPGINAALSVPRASVDSRGNLDLTAHGAITLPPGDPRGILLTVPARTPLNFHVGEDGDFRASGGVRLTLPEDIKLDAFFDIDDPDYVFSLGYSGGVTLDLAREIHAIRPTVDFTAAQPLAMDALAGFAEFFGSFNAGLETLLREEPSLPDPFAIELGEAPEFETPETIVPFDVLDAWLTAIGNDFVRPAINGTLDASIEPARSIIRSMRNEVAAVRADLEPTAADIRSLARVVEAGAAARRKLERAAEVNELSPLESQELLSDTVLVMQDAAQAAHQWLSNLPPGADSKKVLAVCKLLSDATARATQAGVTELPNLSIIPPRLAQTRTTLLASNGFAADASVANAAKVAALSHEDLLVLVFALQEIDSLVQNAGGSVDSIEETRVLVRRWFVKIRDLRQQAIERADMILELEMSAWLAWSLLLHRDLLMLDLPASPVTPTPDELDLMAFSLPDTHAAIVAGRGGNAEANEYAGSVILAATKVQKTGLERVRNRRSALFDEQVNKSSAKQAAGLSLVEISYLNMVRDVTQLMQGRGLLTAAALSGYKDALTNHLDYFRSEQARKSPQVSDVEDNLSAATRDLQQLTEGLAFLHSFMPEKVELIGEFTQSWQALRVSWTAVAEAQKAHWYLTAYVRELDRMATRYGVDLAGAFGLSLRASAMEAMAGLNRVTNAMNGLVATLGSADVAFPLPGDLKINSAFGKLAFNRVTGDWTLGFGGGIEFPESKFALDVFDASLSKDGSFSLNLGTSGEVPLGGVGSKMKFVVPQFEVTGSTTQQQFAFETDGTLTYDPTTATGDEFSLNLGVSYDSQTGVVGLDAGLNNSPVRFGEDLVLLDGEVGLDFSVQNPQGALELAGTFGVLARQKPLPAGALQANDFWLTVSVAPTRFNFAEDAMTAEISGGSITLPADLFSSQAQAGDPPVTVAISSPLCLRYEFASGELTFCNPAGQPFVADLTNFKLVLAELPGFQLAIASARLELNGSEFPVLRNLNAAVTVPLPGANANDASQNTSATFSVSAQNWRIDGLPEAASIGIAQNLLLADFNGLKLELLGGSAFSLASTPDFPRILTLGLNGGIRAGFDERILRNNATGNAVFLTGNGALSWDMQSLPVLQNLDLALEGNFRFGADGPAITGLEDNTLARLEVENVGGLFNQLASPVIITLEGAVDIPNAVKFGLVNSRFILRGNGLEFEPGGVQTELRGQTLDLAKDVLPVYLTKIRMEFKDPHPLVPATPGGPALFDLTNLKFILSGGANIPNGALLDAGTPGLSGEVRDLEIGLRRDSQGNLLQEFNLDAISLQVENLTIPPLAELKGGIALVNLDQLSLDPPRPERVTFVGELGGSFNGTGVGALVASSATEFHGLAISASAGSVPAGIPLDGYVLGGILWNGATGGIHFKNSFDDPTEFSTYLQRDTEGRITGASEFPPPGDPGTNPTNISDPFDELEGGDELYTKSDLPETAEGFDPFDMLQDNWPPRAANPLLEEFPPNSGRLVFKASRLSTAQADDFLDRIGLTEGATRDMEQIITAFLTEMTVDIRAQGDVAVTALIAASGVVGDQTLATHYQELSDKLVDSFDDAARPVLRQILQSALQAGTSLRPPLRDLLTSGIPGFNVTFLGSGTFSHTALAPVMDVKGTVSVSTTGAALSRGELRVSGVPVAEASVGFSLTNEDGNISPFLGGLARVGIGPLEFGKLTMSASLPDAAAVVGHFDTFLQCSLSTLGAGAQAQFEIIAENAIGAQVPAGMALQDFLLARDDREKLAVAGALFDYFARAAEGTLPQQFALAQDDFNSLLNCFAVFVSSALNSFTPEIGFGGKIQPSLFDIPMTASGMPLASARMRFGPVLRTPTGSESLIDLLGNPAANLAPGTLPGVREFSAYAQFSPTALILSPISGLFIALNPSNAAFVGFTALDSAELGFSSQIEEWTPEKVLIFLTNPPQYFADRTEEFFNTAVLAAGYKMSPFGMNLADGQLRVVFPDSILHPRRPGGINAARLGNPIRPFDSNGTRTLPLPSTDELILAALTAGKIKDATFRGGLDQLDDLFPPPPAEPATDGNLRKVHAISASMRALDPGLSDLSGKSFAKDYFPYGGIIGGGQLALPQLLTRGLPPNWGDLFTKQGAEWLQSFDSVVTFLASTDSVGQLAYYVPAPNPVLFPGEDPAAVWADMTIDDLLRRLQMDPAALVGRSINTDLYEVNEINLAGWAKADLLGIPLGEARLGYDGNSRRLLATAQVPPNTTNDGNWFNDFLSGQAQFSIQLPSDQQSGLVTYGAAELFTHIQQNLGSIQSLSGTELDARIVEIQDSLKGALPRISAEIESGVQLPPQFANVLRSSSGVGLFAFSPYFEPEYEPSNISPYAVSRRRGGIGIKGAFDFGYFPPSGDPLVISVPDVSLALTPAADVAVLPAITGQIQVDAFQIPGAPSFTNGLLQFASSPDNGAPYLLVNGEIEPFAFQLPSPLGGMVDLLRAQPLTPGSLLGGTFSVLRADGQAGNAALGLSLNAMSASVPFFGPGAAVTLHGGALGGGQFAPFTFSTAPGQPWSAQLAISAPNNPIAAPVFSIRDPFSPSGASLLTFTPTGPVSGSVSGQGLDSFNAQFTVPTGFELVFYPGTANESRVATPAGNNFVFAFDSAGRFYCDLGSLTNISLPGLITAGARIEFGYNPNDPKPDVRIAKNNNEGFLQVRGLSVGSVNLVNSLSETFEIRNVGTRVANINIEVLGSTEFIPSTDGLQLEPGGERTITIVFQPRAAGFRSATVRVTSDDPVTPTRTFFTTGEGLAEPIYVASRPNVNFGDTLVGATSTTTFTVGNSGSASLVINSASVAGTGFTVTPTGSITLGAGQSRNYTVTFTPGALGPASGTLDLNINAPVGPKSIPLSGNGSESRWITLLDAEAAGTNTQLNAIRMLDASAGFAVGNAGSFLETQDGGRSWTQRNLTRNNLMSIALNGAPPASNTAAIYHFDEPVDSTLILDSSGNVRRGGSMPSTASLRPIRSFGSGRFGAGFRFDGTDDFLELGQFGLPSASSGDFSISLWTRYTQLSATRTIVSNSTSTGSNRLRISTNGTQYLVVRGSDTLATSTGIVPLNQWVHVVLTSSYDSAANQTTLRIFQNGTQQGSLVSTGQVALDTSMPWMLGAQRISSTTRSNFHSGDIDEVMFFEKTLTTGEIDALRRVNLQRMVVAGQNGTVIQSFNRGRLWAQHPDLNAFGWRNRTRVFESLNYNAASFLNTTAGSKLYLGGYHNPSGNTRNRRVMIEANHPGVDAIAGNADDEFDLVSITGGPSVLNPEMTGLHGFLNSFVASSTDGVTYTQASQSGTTQSFAANSAVSAARLNALAAHGDSGGMVVVGNSGRILHSAAGTNPSAVTSGTAQNLLGVVHRPGITPAYHVVGDNGTYLTSDNAGANWQVVTDGLSGNMRAVDAVQVPGGTASDYHVWAAGENHTINYRPPALVSGPFMTFFPGKVDFGFVLAGQSRTQEIRISNRGKQPLVINSLSIFGSSRFTIPTTSLAQIMPGETQTLSVRYRPTAASALDVADLTITVAGGSQGPFRVPLSGRSGTQDWLPVALPVEGEVVDVIFTSDTVGYALAQPLTGATQLYRTTNGGVSWGQIGAFPALGGTLRLNAVAASDSIIGPLVLVGGFLEGPNRGVVLQGVLSDELLPGEPPGGETRLQESWTEKTPGGAAQALPIVSLDMRDVAGGFPISIASTSGANATVWRDTTGDGTWTTTSNRPSATFTGGPVRMLLFDERDSRSAHMVAASSNELFVAIASASSWSTSSKKLSAFAGSSFKAMDSKPSGSGDFADVSWIVGTNGLFFKLKGDAVTGQESVVPASDAEVFGVTNLTGVSFGNASNGYVCGESRIFTSGDGGSSWRLSFDAGDEAQLLAVSTRSQLRAWAGGSLANRATVWRYTPPPTAASGLINVADTRDWGNVAVAASSTQTINVANNSTTALPLHNIRIETDEPRSRFRLSGTLPTTISGNSSTNLSVVFDATPEESFAEELDPYWYFRFENEWDSTVFTDSSANARGAELPATVTQRPTLALSQFRDRALRFDAGDHLEVNQNPGPDDLGGPFSIALWAAPELVDKSSVMVAKDTATGGDLVKFSLIATGYSVRVGASTFTFTGAGAAPLEWQHLVANFEPSGGSTIVTVYRNGNFLFQTTLAATVGNIAGKNWVIGGEYTSSTAIGNRFIGALDDVMLVPRVLTESEIARLAGKSSLVGEHRARLVIDSGSENGTREVSLRAAVGAEPRFLTINTEPQGLPVKVDGVDFVAPVSFAIVPFASTTSGAREWIEGSQHRIEVPESVTRNHAGGSVNYRFADWSSGPSRQFTITANRDVALTHTATFVASEVAAPLVQAPPPRAPNGPNPLLTALADAPKGPFLRISGGNLRLPNLAGNNFAITGDLFLSLSRIQGQLASTAFVLPESGTSKFLEIGASNWRIDATAGGPLFLEARPPSLALLGYDVLPDGLTRLQYAPAVGSTPAAWAVSFQLARDFKPFPDMLEFKKGGVELRWLASAGPPAFTFALDGGIRVLRLPNSSFALDRNVAVRLNTADFDIGLNDMFAAAGQAPPANLFASGPFTVGWSDVRLQRAGGGPVTLSLAGAPFSFQENLITTIGGRLNSLGKLQINGALGENGVVSIDPNNHFFLEALNSSQFTFEISPRRLALGTPAMRLRSTSPEFSSGVVIPGVRFDSSGAFDTGKIKLPTLTFDGISVSGPADGSRDNNHIRFQRDTASRTTFTVKSEQAFLNCNQNLALAMTSVSNGAPAVNGSMSGNFCILPEPISLRYNSGNGCQFSGSAFGFTVFFGSNCAGVRNDATGICVFGGCP